MKRILFWVAFAALSLTGWTQDCPTEFVFYTTDGYAYSCQQDVNTRQLPQKTFLQGLRRDALSALAEQFEVNVTNQDISEMLSVNGKSTVNYSSLTTFSTDVTLRLAQVRDLYDNATASGAAIAYINKKQAREFYHNEYNQAISAIRTAIGEANILISKGHKIRARDEKLNPAFLHFQKAYDALAWLNLFDFPREEMTRLLAECKQLRQQFTEMQTDLLHGVAIYLNSNAKFNGQPYPTFASEIKGHMEKMGCHFVDTPSEADWVFDLNIQVSKTSHYERMAFFAWVDGEVTITNRATGKVVYENRLSAMEPGHPDGIKGDGDTRSYDSSARDAYKRAARIVAEKGVALITQ